MEAADRTRAPARRHGGIQRNEPQRRRFRPGAGEERDLIDVEVAPSGRVSLFSGRGSDRHTPTGVDVLLDAAVVTLTRSVATLAGLIAPAIGFAGPWQYRYGPVGRRRPAQRVRPPREPPHESTPLKTARHAQVTATTSAELLDHPERPTRHLTGPLLWALGTRHEDRLRPARSHPSC